MPHYKLVKATILFSDFTTVCIQDIAIYKLSFFSSSTFFAFYETLLLLRYSSTNLTWDKLLLFMARNLNKKRKESSKRKHAKVENSTERLLKVRAHFIGNS